jgi:hypothetical protein
MKRSAYDSRTEETEHLNAPLRDFIKRRSCASRFARRLGRRCRMNYGLAEAQSRCPKEPHSRIADAPSGRGRRLAQGVSWLLRDGVRWLQCWPWPGRGMGSQARRSARSKVDAVDWVERIPFAETRNYVQRVMENLQVYCGRFGASTATVEPNLHRAAPVGSRANPVLVDAIP